MSAETILLAIKKPHMQPMGTIRCIVCGGEHEPGVANCDAAGMDRNIQMMGARRWNQISGYIQRKLWARYREAKRNAI